MSVLVAISEKNRTSGQMSLITVAWNFLAVHVPRNRGFAETMLAAKTKDDQG